MVVRRWCSPQLPARVLTVVSDVVLTVVLEWASVLMVALGLALVLTVVLVWASEAASALASVAVLTLASVAASVLA